MYINYQVNRDYIILNYCVNRDQPKKKCHGKCHLGKMLSAGEKKEIPSNPKEIKETLLFFSLTEFFAVRGDSAPLLFHVITPVLPVRPGSGVFHPPCIA